jgi:excisionase family DNA binding protein
LERLLTPIEIADFLGVKISTVYKWTHERFIPFTKVGRLLRFRESEIQRWLARWSFENEEYRKIGLERHRAKRHEELPRIDKIPRYATAEPCQAKESLFTASTR